MPHRDPHKKHRSPEELWRNEPSDVSALGSPRSIKPTDSTSWSLLEKVRSMFSWIANRVTEEAREEVSTSVGETSAKRLLSQYSSQDLIRRAGSSIAQIKLSKQAFLQEFGTRAQAFVDRYIDPVVEPIKSFVHGGREEKVSETLKGAVGSVELLAMLHDETRLRRKIRDSLESRTRDIILEDISFILSYPSEALEDAAIPAAHRGFILREIEESLQPILLELESLLSVCPPSYEFIPLFQWRVGVDSKRQHLHDCAMQVIDEKIHKRIPLWRSLKELPAKEIFPFLEELELVTEKDRIWPLSIFELEEISSHLREIIEGEVASRQDKRLLMLFDHMKAHVEVLLESEGEEDHEKALMRIVDQVRAIELLLGLKAL
jgi:hypothetical protein